MRRARFDRGDIVRINLDPTVGREQQGAALVLTPAIFNTSGLAVIVPISQGGDFSRHAGFAVTLSGAGTQTQGVMLCNQLRTVDLEARGAKRIESVPEAVILDALARVQTLFD
ncbi:type II toxin-antitoxin system ChpB family toxin [Pseudomonas sichuanensis]|uniref:type II toxin-antitoxin system ChpB family toxin n=1 Tax=Pseudomonas sichuanensis TaxID=2213015 RepID=UPI002446DFE2|nr:type II toxin-antitoxin system ChpB family toxin [Pseudomonas sichuanensis]MDH0729954.1 type II toxin-antitoxin system ChpB family toxin [Pseudomonas sichuanensis]MDH1584787.1 type II toxin-antitoxin system ChpB family toxin [Pseudomonas sichuanensis]MDH1593958.1 type II toxin-antitoxin system ChpB family toxin [Pseudomonas sichuanensis]MDH1600713.1 type II toxin-antitoxin system ChpB family toxin [Pseudomonas sichuanensis]